MPIKDSLPFLQESGIGPYIEPAQSNLYSHILQCSFKIMYFKFK